jgi:hypothetical protein
VTRMTSDLRERLETWATRLDLASDTIRMRTNEPVALVAVDTVEGVAAEIRTLLAHVSTWPAPGRTEE